MLNDSLNKKNIEFDPAVLDDIEKLSYGLRNIYMKHGFERFKMSKFEEYDLYVRNKDFLVSDSVITFTDTTGRLMALKPDVTLSIIKNSRDNPDSLQKICYNENVYRISQSTGSFKEILQAGLECFGNVDNKVTGEVLGLAADSLALTGREYVIETAQLDILASFAEEISSEPAVKDALLKCVSEKNLHGIDNICAANDMPSEKASDLKELAGLYGPPGEVFPKLEMLCRGKGIDSCIADFRESLSSFKKGEHSSHVIIDFSAVSDLKYYNGIIFSGFVQGVPGSVLSGGCYDKLMKRMGRKSKAIGFAVYLDMLERL